ncbi:MAG: hypothetical protein JXQ89_10930 [Pelagimonas sp.]
MSAQDTPAALSCVPNGETPFFVAILGDLENQKAVVGETVMDLKRTDEGSAVSHLPSHSLLLISDAKRRSEGRSFTGLLGGVIVEGQCEDVTAAFAMSSPHLASYFQEIADDYDGEVSGLRAEVDRMSLALDSAQLVLPEAKTTLSRCEVSREQTELQREALLLELEATEKSEKHKIRNQNGILRSYVEREHELIMSSSFSSPPLRKLHSALFEDLNHQLGE